MNPVSEIKRFILRALNRAEGLPVPDDSLNAAIGQAVVPRPLQSDVNQAKRELEGSEFIQGKKDDLDGTLTWTLTSKGLHRAAQLG